jgi:hypothetical protein
MLPYRFLLVTTYLYLASFSVIPSSTEPKSTVHLVPVGVFGDTIDEDVSVDAFEALPKKKDFAHHFHGNVGVRVPYGIYRARIYTRGFWSSERLITISEPETVAVVALAIGTEGGPQTSNLSGRFRGASPTGGPVRIRLSGVYSGTVIDTEANKSGEFSVTNVLDGTYVVIATQQDRATLRDRVLSVKAICIPLKNSGPLVLDADAPGELTHLTCGGT